jgi:hypothetical protein
MERRTRSPRVSDFKLGHSPAAGKIDCPRLLISPRREQARVAMEEAFEEIKNSEDQLRRIIDAIPTRRGAVSRMLPSSL